MIQAAYTRKLHAAQRTILYLVAMIVFVLSANYNISAAANNDLHCVIALPGMAILLQLRLVAI